VQEIQNSVLSAKPDGKSGYLRRVPAVDQAIRILISLAANRNGAATLTEIAQEVGVNKSKALAILNTLQAAGMVTRSPRSKIYRLGPGLLPLSRALLDHTDIAQASAPYLRELAAATNSTALLGSVAGGHLFVMARSDPPEGPGIAVHVGHRRPLYSASHGKAILAAMSEADRERALAEGPLQFTLAAGQGSRDLDRLRAELKKAASQGFALDLGVTNQGLNAISSALVDPYATASTASGPSRVVGCLIVVGTFPRAKVAQYGGRVAAAAHRVSTELAPLLHPSD
jgi:DNA-binding IclR family transcriptional regulator